jgi:hypothetical protein
LGFLTLLSSVTDRNTLLSTWLSAFSSHSFLLVFDDDALFQSFLLRRTWTNNNLHDFDDDQLALLFVIVAIPSSIIVIGNLGIEGRRKGNKFEEKEGPKPCTRGKLEQTRGRIIHSQSSKYHANTDTAFANHDNPVAR